MNTNTTPAQNHTSRKKKNTYLIHVQNMLMQYNLFELCKSAPLPIMSKNGTQPSTPGGWIDSIAFPNPGATKLETEYELISPYMGDRTARTIIEYLDKSTGKPVVTVFPTSIYIHDGYENNYMSHMNHASRRDFAHQLEIRKRALEQMRVAHQY